MCTAITYYTKDHYFGRNLDIECSFGEKIVIVPRNFKLYFRYMDSMEVHYAMIGVANVESGYPLYYDAINEKGLGMAGLNFPGNAVYNTPVEGAYNIAVFELIPWILGQCENVDSAVALMEKINIIDEDFSKELPVTPLHWMIADKEKSIVIEQTAKGMDIYHNPVGVMTNNPTFDYHLMNLNNYMGIGIKTPTNSFSDKLNLKAYSRGMGGIGLPGDLSSASRFVKAAFTKLNSVSKGSENESVSQFFHILGSVEQQMGCVEVSDKDYEVTLYSSCCNLDKGIYYYTTYGNRQISAIDMNKTNLNENVISIYPMRMDENILYMN